MKFLMRWGRFAVIAAGLALAGCGGKPPPPAVLTLTIIGGADQNPDQNQHATVVAVRLYQLTATGKFESIDVYTLIGQEAAALGGDEAGPSEQFLLAPGQTLTETRAIKPDVVAAGIAVLFRQINQSTWKLVLPLAASGTTKATLRVSGLTATVAANK
jgi:type VI secretion system protein VasD